jgi:ubiquinone/menaquinone biosynthesis C-methylase UbiE
LALHQFPDRARVLTEVARILQPRGLLIIRTITPEAAQQRMPFRFFPRMAEIEAARMPPIADLEALFTGAGFTLVETEVVERHKALDFQTVLREVQARPSYQVLTAEECTRGMMAMQEEWRRHEGPVVDPRPTLFMVGQQQGL